MVVELLLNCGRNVDNFFRLAVMSGAKRLNAVGPERAERRIKSKHL